MVGIRHVYVRQNTALSLTAVWPQALLGSMVYVGKITVVSNSDYGVWITRFVLTYGQIRKLWFFNIYKLHIFWERPSTNEWINKEYFLFIWTDLFSHLVLELRKAHGDQYNIIWKKKKVWQPLTTFWIKLCFKLSYIFIGHILIVIWLQFN